MINGHKVIAVTPVGRRSTLSILSRYMNYFLAKGQIDEWHLWVNTKNTSDIAYFQFLAETSDKIKLIGPLGEEDKLGTASNIKFYYKGYNEPDTVYIRIDDDICYMQPEGLLEFIQYRLAHPEYLLLYPVIINNCAMSYKLQQEGIIGPTVPMIGGWEPSMGYPECYKGGVHPLDPMGWGNPQFAYALQSTLINNKNLFRMNNFEWSQREHCCINVVSWLGEGLGKYDTEVDYDEEIFLTQKLPTKLGKYNGVYGNYVVGHYSFYIQKQYLDATDLLEKYRVLARELTGEI